MRRAGLVLFAVLASLVLVAPPASADGRGGHGQPPIARTGTFEGAGSYELGTVCPFAWEVISGTFDGSRRPGADGTFTLDYCVSIIDFSVAGTFTIVTRSGITLSGPVTGTIVLDPVEVRIELTLTVTDSQGTRRPITGTISASGIRTEPGGYTATIAGTFETALSR